MRCGRSPGHLVATQTGHHLPLAATALQQANRWAVHHLSAKGEQLVLERSARASGAFDGLKTGVGLRQAEWGAAGVAA